MNLLQQLEAAGASFLESETVGIATAVAGQGSSVKSAVAATIQTSGATTLETAQAAVNDQLPALTASITAQLPAALQTGLVGALANFALTTLFAHEVNQAFVGIDNQALGAGKGAAATVAADNLP